MSDAKKQFGPPYKDYMYEDDPDLVPRTPEYLAVVDATTFGGWENKGLKPDSKELSSQTPERLAKYTKWLTYKV